MTTSIRLRPVSKRPSTAAVLLLITAACWAYLFVLRSEMGDMSAMADMPDMGAVPGMGEMETARSILAMPMTSAWTAGDVVLMWTMWAVMMAAMMIPSATPMIQAYSTTVESAVADVPVAVGLERIDDPVRCRLPDGLERVRRAGDGGSVGAARRDAR